MPERATLTRLLGRLLLAVLVPVLVLGVVEVGLRMVGYGYPTRLYLPVPDAGTYGANQEFGLRFFPKGIVRRPVPQAFSLTKQPRTCRVFVLGASAALGIPASAFSFSRVLEVMLEQQYPGVRFELVNTSITAINSNVVLPIARECEDYEPDLFIIYLGNNEVIGPYGAGSDIYGPVSSLRAIRLGIALRTTKIGQLLQALIGKVSGQDKILSKWGGMEMFAENIIGADDPKLQAVRDHFRTNLHDICQAGLEGGAAVVVSTVSVNVKDSAPFASLHRPDLTVADLASWKTAYDAGCRAQAAGDEALAGTSFAHALEIDDQYADLQFRAGQVALAAGDTTAAAAHFATALERDGLRFRTDAELNAIIKDMAREFAGANLHVADTAAYVAAHEPSHTGCPGAEVFYEHVHLKFAGNYLVARSLWPSVVAALPDWVKATAAHDMPLPDLEACEKALVFTPWNEYKNLAQIRTMVTRYPFTNQTDHAEHLAAIDQQLLTLRNAATPEVQRQTFEDYRRATEARPHDLLLNLMFYNLLKDLQQFQAAKAVLTRIMATQPPWPDAQVDAALQ